MLETLHPMIREEHDNFNQLNKKKRESDPTSELSTKTNDSNNQNQKIQFNDYVEQYIAIDKEDNIDDEKPKDCSMICKLVPTKLKDVRIYHDYSLLCSTNTNNSNNSSNSNKSINSGNSNNSSNSSNSNDTSWNYFQFFFFIIIVSVFNNNM
jgi:hypothetical protein